MSLKSLWLHQQNMITFPKANSSNTVPRFKPSQIYLSKSFLTNPTQPELISPSTQLLYPSCMYSTYHHLALNTFPESMIFPFVNILPSWKEIVRPLKVLPIPLGTSVTTHSALTYETLAIYCLFNISTKLLIFWAVLHGMWDLSSLTRDWTPAPCSGSAES